MDWWNKGQAVPAQPALAEGIPLRVVGEFLHHFPIGARVHYFPEYQRSMKFDTLVLGCDINGKLVYSDHAVRLEGSGNAAVLTLRTGPGPGERLVAVERFRFLTPVQSRSEMDYGSGLEGSFTEKTVNDFKRGNTITLFNKGANGKVPYLDCTVARVVELREGVYAKRTVALLEPDPESLLFLDQRQYHRVYTRIPATVGPTAGSPGYPCSVQDFSDRYLRLEVDESQAWLRQVQPGAKLFLTIQVPGRPAPFVLGCAVHRRGEAYLVLSLAAILKDRRFQDLDMLDELDIKTSLLHHPETQQSLAEEAARG